MRNHHHRVRFDEESPRSATRSPQETSSPSEGTSPKSAQSPSQQSEPSDILSTTANDGDADSPMWMDQLPDTLELELNDHSMTTHCDMLYNFAAQYFNPLTMARHTIPCLPPLSSVPPSIPPVTSTNPSQLPLPMSELTRMSYTQENSHRITRGAALQSVEARRNNHRTVLERVRDVLPSSARRRRGDWGVSRPPQTRLLWPDEDGPTVDPIGTGRRPQMSLQPTQNPESIQRPVQPYNTIGSTPNPNISSASASQSRLDRHLPNPIYDNMNDTWTRNTNLRGPRFHRRPLPLYEPANGAAAQNIRKETAAERNNQLSQPPTLLHPRVIYPPAPPSLAAPPYNPYVLAPLRSMDPYSNTYQQSVERHASSSRNNHPQNNDPAPAGSRQRNDDGMRGLRWRHPYFAPLSGGERTGDGPPGTPVEDADVDTETEDTHPLSPSSTTLTDLRSRL
ncbi:hypothetical protein B0A52_07178 [Exophiala mesophila]|uniref:Uncharacterized protein n=1 Tax=Exophiala mesophila TaxID=212818 RepID=A0A438N0I7_EXOME|nr:hypothetical protein B0A52_07178 [Exophiala mesophila]